MTERDTITMIDDVSVEGISLVDDPLPGSEARVVNYVQTVPDPFREELTHLLNRYSKENGSNTPDFQLAFYLLRCLEVFDETVRFREAWYGRNPNRKPGS